jgi:hypothetical protein
MRIPNLVFIGFVGICLINAWATAKQVQPLVQADHATASRIAQLELWLQRHPSNMAHTLELARLYQEVGEFPWSYHALLTAEKTWSKDPVWRLLLGLAYLDLGKNDDSVRVLKQAKQRCKETSCTYNIRTKLDIFTRLAELFIERKIDSRKHSIAAERALREILKPVEVDPDKMRPKAPATPEATDPKKPRG